MAKLVKKTPPQIVEPDFMPDVRRVGTLAAKHKAVDLRAYDVRGLTVIADAFVIVGAASAPQLRAIFNAVREGMKEAGVAPLHTEGTFSGGWMLIDYGNIIFHAFRNEAREFYDLDGFWGDAPQVDLGGDR